VPSTPDDPAAPANRKAWETLEQWTKPFLCAYSDNDPITARADAVFKKMVPGCRDQPHTTVEGGGHFLQEDRGPELAKVIAEFIANS
jgi:haloalkane dehalogenase